MADEGEGSAPRWVHSVGELAPAYDHIVVGGGSAGCVLARRLAERGARVLLAEAGPDDAGRADVADPARWTAMLRGPLDWGLSYAPDEAVADRTIGIPRGRVLGGSSSTNAMLWHRGHPSDYDAWAAAGATGWSYADCLPAFRRCEDFAPGLVQRHGPVQPGDAVRGRGGPLRLERPRDPHPAARALLEAAAQRGHRVLADPAWGPGRPGVGDTARSADPTGAADPTDTDGASLAVLNTGNGRRWSTARGYLRDPGADLATLTVATGALVRRVELDGTRARGVTLSLGGSTVRVAVDGEVLLAAGAIESPRLLLASGLGDPADLARLRVPCRAALPGVGRNLADHPLVEGVNLRARAPIGPVRDNGGGAVLTWRSATPRSPAPDLHAFVVQGASATPEVLAAHGIDRADGDVIGIGFGLMGSRSRGWMRVHDLAPGGAVELRPCFLSDPADLAALVEGLEEVLELTATRAFTALAPTLLSPASRAPGRSGAEAFIRSACSTFFHACGTAAMGTGQDAVVDPQLRVHGTQGLRVVDASVFPTIPTGNTQAPVVMVAERAADLVSPVPA